MNPAANASPAAWVRKKCSIFWSEFALVEGKKEDVEKLEQLAAQIQTSVCACSGENCAEPGVEYLETFPP